jgi:hypothetical protein
MGFLEGKQNDVVLEFFFSKKKIYFLFKQRHFSNFASQNDVVLGFPFIFTVSSNGWSQIIRGW